MLVFDNNDDCWLSSCTAENYTIKYSTMKSGVFPCTQEALQEGCQCKCSAFTQIVAQCINRTPMNNCCGPWVKEPVALAANWSVLSRTNW